MNISPIMIFGLTSIVFGSVIYLFIKYTSEVKTSQNQEKYKKVIPKVNIESGFSVLSVVLLAISGVFVTPWMITFSESMEKPLLLKFFLIISTVFVSVGFFIHRVGIKEWEDNND